MLTPFDPTREAAIDIQKRVILGGLAAGGLTAVLIVGVVALAPEDSRPSQDGLPPSYARLEVPPADALQADPAALFERNCAGCHGTDPSDIENVHPGPDPTPLYERGPQWMYWRISEGKQGTPMPAFKDFLSDEERWALVRYLREQLAAKGG